MTFSIAAFEKEIIDHRCSAEQKERMVKLMTLVSSSNVVENSRLNRDLASLRRWREKSSNEDNACDYEDKLFSKLSYFFPKEEAEVEAQPESNPVKSPKKGDTKLGWSGMQKFNGAEWVNFDSGADEDLQMETGYESHATIEGLSGTVTESKPKPSEQCKAAGLSGLNELSELLNQEAKPNTLINWHKNKPAIFNAVLAGAVKLKESQ